MTAPPDVELRDATVRLGDISVSVSLQANAGRRLALVGPSGCGKTTTLRMIAGLTPLDGGDVFLGGKSMGGVRPEQRNVVMVFQDPALFPFHTVAENVGYGLKVRKVSPSARSEHVQAALDAVQLGGYADRWPGDLSGGERQRVALARALVVEPQVLLLDEPFASLDPSLRRDLQDLVCTLQEDRGMTALFVTHDFDEARAISHDLAVMIAGRIRQVGPTDQVSQHPVDDVVASFLQRPNPTIGATP